MFKYVQMGVALCDRHSHLVWTEKETELGPIPNHLGGPPPQALHLGPRKPSPDSIRLLEVEAVTAST